MTASDPAPDPGCQAAWLASVMWSVGALVDKVDPCAERPEVSVGMRMSELDYAAVFDVRVCHGHHETLRQWPSHVGSEDLTR